MPSYVCSLLAVTFSQSCWHILLDVKSLYVGHMRVAIAGMHFKSLHIKRSHTPHAILSVSQHE